MSTRALIGVMVAGIVGVLIFLFVHLSNESTIGSKTASACTKGDSNCIPVVNYVDTTGKAYTPQSLSGKVVVVNFWATWCHPCEGEIPDLSKVYDAYKDKGVVFLGVLSGDDPPDGTLLNFASDHAMTYPIVRENADIKQSFGYPDKLPTTFVYGRDGKQELKRIGQVHEDEMRRLLDKLVAEKPPA
jgi:thiol-disulfide isomerase/thioredoxin|nr:TlpA disulfide reductase family protein [Kofleriaceae bacterium]